jgi:nucleoside-diphosphate-sugar epimerase
MVRSTASESAARQPETVLVTGALGYIGDQLMTRLIAAPDFIDSRILALDQRVPDQLPTWAADPRVTVSAGDLTDPAVRDDVLKVEPDVVFHLAGILGGAAETDYESARRVNVDGSLRLLEGLRRQAMQGRVARVVYASSIAVFGPPLPAVVDDATHPVPVMTYGGQKLMIEGAIEQFSARKWIDGLALRLPGIVAREDADSRQISAFLSAVFYAARDRRSLTLPVSPHGRTWLLSARAVIDSLIHAALLSSERLGTRRAMTLPAQVVRMEQLVEALDECFPGSRSLISYGPNTDIEAQFASQPLLSTELAEGLGFECDADLSALIAHALESEGD